MGNSNPFGVRAERYMALLRRMQELGIAEGDLRETFIRGGGSGGQKVNKTAHCVRLCHPPSGIEVRVEQERSRATNRYLARRLLMERYAEEILGERSSKTIQREKIRKQKKRRASRARAKNDQEK